MEGTSETRKDTPCGFKILLVDDDFVSRVFALRALTVPGWEVKVLSDGQEALANLSTFDPDLVITDLFMPEMNGMALISALRERGYKGTVILLTAGDVVTDSTTASLLQGGFLLTKPVGMHQLREVVGSALNSTGHVGLSP